jgi:hypothetical protein
MTMAAIIYTLCALTAVICAWLLLRSYIRTRYRLLLWSGLCFVGLSVSNILVVLDRVVLPDVDISLPRLFVSLAAMLLLLFGLISENK